MYLVAGGVELWMPYVVYLFWLDYVDGTVTWRIITCKGDLFYFYLRYSTLLHLLPLRIHCVGGCWDRTQGFCEPVG
jgi:hypothetical protein